MCCLPALASDDDQALTGLPSFPITGLPRWSFTTFSARPLSLRRTRALLPSRFKRGWMSAARALRLAISRGPSACTSCTTARSASTKLAPLFFAANWLTREGLRPIISPTCFLLNPATSSSSVSLAASLRWARRPPVACLLRGVMRPSPGPCHWRTRDRSTPWCRRRTGRCPRRAAALAVPLGTPGDRTLANTVVIRRGSVLVVPQGIPGRAACRVPPRSAPCHFCAHWSSAFNAWRPRSCRT